MKMTMIALLTLILNLKINILYMKVANLTRFCSSCCHSLKINICDNHGKWCLSDQRCGCYSPKQQSILFWNELQEAFLLAVFPTSPLTERYSLASWIVYLLSFPFQTRGEPLFFLSNALREYSGLTIWPYGNTLFERGKVSFKCALSKSVIFFYVPRCWNCIFQLS